MKDITFKVVIPARYASTRLPGKPLIEIAGQPMIAHVCQRALEANAQQVVVATDDQRIFDCVTKLGFDVLMTDVDHQSGTERINQVAQELGWNADDIVVNLQGDEPLIPPSYIRDVALALGQQTQADIATLAAKINDSREVFNPNAVKVVLDHAGYALYFSRAAIPFDRQGFDVSDNKVMGNIASQVPYLRHIGMYAYRVKFLEQYCHWEASKLESVESLEQLRILWYGQKILVRTVGLTPEAGVDTEEDLNRVEQAMQNLS